MVETPEFHPQVGAYAEARTAAISCGTESAAIRYTTDGTTPDGSSDIYTGPISVPESGTIKAYAYREDMEDSDVASAEYVISAKVETPAFSPEEGIYTEAQTVSISCGTEGAEIRYTTDGTTPDESSDIYTGPISVPESGTIKAYAYREDMEDSDVASAEYVISAKVETPAFSPEEGIYTETQTVNISCGTEGAEIRYTMDGTTPDESSALYTAPITISESATLKAYAVLSGMEDSDIASATYSITPQANNIALNKTAASDSEDTANGNTAEKAVDGDSATYWSAANDAANHWLKVDLNGSYDLSGTEVEWQLDGKIYKYVIEVSKDNVSWVVKADKNDNASTAKIQADGFTAYRVRYVRITITGLEAGVTASIAEFKVFGTQSPPDTEPPTAPANLICTGADEAFAVLKWDASADNDIVTGYNIYQDGELAGTTNQLIYTVTDLTPLTAYTFTVKAMDASENESPASRPLVVETLMRLDHDTTMESLVLHVGVIDLNGYRLTVNTDLIQAGGTVNINKGYLEVKGDYRIEAAGSQASSGKLKMDNPLDYVKVNGSFVMNSSESHTGLLSDGILEIKGNFTQKSAGSASNYDATNGHKTVMNGPDVQYISFENAGSSMMNVFEINKPLGVYEVTTAVYGTPMMSGAATGITAGEETPFYRSLLEQYKRTSGQIETGGVNPATGGYTYSKTDMVVKIPGFSLDIGHSYSSLNEETGMMGKGWTFSLEGGIATENYSNAKQYIVKLPGRGEERFLEKGGAISGIGTRSRLELAGGIYIVTTTDQFQYGFDTNNRLIWIRDRNDNTVDMNYNASGKMVEIVDAAGRKILLAYNARGLLDTVTDFAQRTVRYQYNGPLLEKAVDPMDIERGYGYDANGYLCGIRNNGDKEIESVRYVTHVDGRVRAIEYMDPLGKVSRYDYGAMKTTVTDMGVPGVDIKWTKNLDIATNNLQDVTYGNGAYVAVGERGIIKTSSDGTTWTGADSGTSNDLYGVAWGGDRYVAVGLYGAGATSTDGTTWTTIPRVTDRTLWGVIWGGDQYVAVGERGTILTSPDGTTWTSRASGTSNHLYGVAWGGDRYVAVGDYGTILTSPDGVTWVTVRAPGERFYEVTWGGSGYVVVGRYGMILTSPDGTTWTSVLYNQPYSLNEVTWGGNGYVAVGNQGTIMTSPDGTAWTTITTAISNNLNGVIRVWNRYIAVGASGIIISSPDGTAWTSITPDSTYALNDVTWGGNQYVAVGASGRIMCSPDGMTWTGADSGTSNYLRKVTWGGSGYVAVGENGTIVTSPDGIIWTTMYSGTSYILRGVTWGGDQYVAVGHYGMILTSPDGIEWTSRSSGTTNVLHGVTWGGDQYVAVGMYGVIVTSPDGIEWTSRSSGTSDILHGVTWGGNGYMAVGGSIVTSLDGITWTARTWGTSPEYKIIWGGNRYVIVGGAINYGSVSITPDGRTWTSFSSGASSYFNGVTWGRGQYVIVAHQTTVFTGTSSSQTQITYDNSYRVTQVLDPENRETDTEYKNDYGDVKSVTDRNTNKTEYETDANGNITKVINPDLSVREMTYDNKNNLRSVKDENGIFTFYVYDADSVNLIKEARPLNGTDQYIEGVSDPAHFAVTEYDYYTDEESLSLGYKAKGLVKTVRDPNGNITAYTYDSYGNVETEKDALGNVTTMENNSLGWTVKTISAAPKSYRTEYFYNHNGDLEKVTLHGGETIRITYDEEGRKVKEVHPNQYDPSQDDLDNHIYSGDHGYRYTYYDNGQVKEIADPENNTTRYVYDVYGGISSVTMPNGSIYEYEYDVMGRLILVSFKENRLADKINLERHSYTILPDGKTQRQITTYPIGSIMIYNVYTYDYAGRQVEWRNTSQNITKTEYYPNGLKKSVTDPVGHITYYAYDGLNRLIEEKIPFARLSGIIYYTLKKYAYDKTGNLISYKITKNKLQEAEAYNEIGYEYDARNLLVKITNHDDGTPVNYTQYYYDEDGNKVRMYTGLSAPLLINGLDDVTHQGDTEYAITRYDYNYMGNLIKLTDPLEMEVHYGYDLNGNLDHTVDRNNNVVNMTYDNMNRLLTRSVACADSSNNASYSYAYDELGNMIAMNGGGADASYAYDSRGRLVGETWTNGVVKEYAWDRTGRRTSFKLYVSGQLKQDVSYAYDNYGRLHQVMEDGITIATYQYDRKDNITSLIYNVSGVRSNYSYNLANRVSSIDNRTDSEILSRYSYNYYLDGNPEYLYDYAGNMTLYAYDGLSRLKTINGPGGAVITYTYDDSGNRSTMSVTGVSDPYSVSYAYDINNRLLTETKTIAGGNETTDYAYDDNGNQISKGGGTYKYNGFNQLIQVNKDGLTSTYAYDGTGLRTSKTVGETTTAHIWDGERLAFEIDHTGTVMNSYIRGINLIYSNSGDANNKYYLYNIHGDVTQLTDNAGNVIKDYDYDAFGNERAPDPADTNVFRYSGEYFDKEIGAYYLRARYYDPANSRWLSEDPIKDGLNWYTYCYNNPVMFVDPSGLKTIALRSAIEGLGGTVIWNDITKTATAYLDGQSVKVYAGDENSSYINNSTMYTDDAWLFVALGSIFDLGKGWTGRMERNSSGDGYQRHVHIYKGNKSWAQNEDGSPHDDGNNSPGSPPNSALNNLKKKKGWDWKQKEKDWLNKIEIGYDPAGYTMISYPNGRTVTVYRQPSYILMPYPPSAQKLRDYSYGPTYIDLYGSGTVTNPTGPFVIPIPNPVPIPVPVPIPIPILP